MNARTHSVEAHSKLVRMNKRIGLLFALMVGLGGWVGQHPSPKSGYSFAQSDSIPGRFGFGRFASAQHLARLDSDVRPDGVGLPSGWGTADTYPTYPVQVERGWIEIRGLAWSGRGKVVRVEVSTDAGRSWQVTELQQPVLDKAHVRFRHFWRWDGAETEICSRVTDETGYTQPTLKQLMDARGPDTGGYHLNPITPWVLKTDGRVLHKPQNWR